MSTKGRKPENLQVGRLEIAKGKKAQKTGKKKEKKSELGCKKRETASQMLRDCGAERSMVSTDCLSDDSESGECWTVNVYSAVPVFTLTTSAYVSSA